MKKTNQSKSRAQKILRDNYRAFWERRGLPAPTSFRDAVNSTAKLQQAKLRRIEAMEREAESTSGLEYP